MQKTITKRCSRDFSLIDNSVPGWYYGKKYGLGSLEARLLSVFHRRMKGFHEGEGKEKPPKGTAALPLFSGLWVNNSLTVIKYLMEC
jgi:hypothetical protein